MVCSGSLSSLATVLEAAIPTALGETEFSGVCTDSRHIQPGELFLALVGEQFDGHDYLETAFARGAVAAVVSKPADVLSVSPDRLIKVSDTLVAYQSIGRWWRRQFDIPVIAITGSAGKTSTKELLAAALSCYGSVLKTHANYNNDIGVPKTLLQLTTDHDYCVLEMAMRGPGEITRLGQTAEPTHAIITNVGTAHIGRLGSREAIAQAKCELLPCLDADTGIAILNGEDQLLQKVAATVWQGHTQNFGINDSDNKDLSGFFGWQATPSQLISDGQSFPVPLPGRHQALNYAGVLKVIATLESDLSVLHAAPTLSDVSGGRNQTFQLPDDVYVLDETYNAAPEAVISALKLLCLEGNGRYWAVIGPMRELGDSAAELYAEVGRVAATLPAYICLYDPHGEMGMLAEQVPTERWRRFSDRELLAQWLSQEVQPGDHILFKAARSIQLETLLDQFVQLRYPDWSLPR